MEEAMERNLLSETLNESPPQVWTELSTPQFNNFTGNKTFCPCHIHDPSILERNVNMRKDVIRILAAD